LTALHHADGGHNSPRQSGDGPLLHGLIAACSPAAGNKSKKQVVVQIFSYGKITDSYELKTFGGVMEAKSRSGAYFEVFFETLSHTAARLEVQHQAEIILT